MPMPNSANNYNMARNSRECYSAEQDSILLASALPFATVMPKTNVFLFVCACAYVLF